MFCIVFVLFIFTTKYIQRDRIELKSENLQIAESAGEKMGYVWRAQKDEWGECGEKSKVEVRKIHTQKKKNIKKV